MIAPDSSAPLIVLAAGGTGGHVFPAEALAQELLARNFRLALVTDRRGAAYGGTLGLIETHRVAARAVSGRGVIGLVRGAGELALGVSQAAALLRRLKPAAVVGFGGYAAVPATAAALILGLPTAIHEQNAVLGRANRLFARRAARVCTSFDLARPPPGRTTVVRTGMPVRAAVAAVRATPYVPPDETGPFRIVVLGGSQGARVFSTVVPAAIARLPEVLRRRIEIAQQARPEDIDATHAAFAATGVHVELRHFFDNVPELMAKAHVLIVRAGASTVAEVAAAGRPAIFVPYPYATDDHQTANARALALVGGGWVIPQGEFDADALAARLAALAADPGQLADTAAAAAAFSIPDAAARLAQVVTGLIGGARGAADAPVRRTGPQRGAFSVIASLSSANAQSMQPSMKPSMKRGAV